MRIYQAHTGAHLVRSKTRKTETEYDSRLEEPKQSTFQDSKNRNRVPGTPHATMQTEFDVHVRGEKNKGKTQNNRVTAQHAIIRSTSASYNSSKLGCEHHP